MKKQTIILLISVLLTYKGISQTASDSVTCIPNSQLKRAINLIEEGKVLKQDLVLTNQKVNQLDSLISVKNNLITEYKKTNNYQENMIASYKSIIGNLEKNISNGNVAYQLQQKKYRKEKFKKWGTLLIGVACGFVIFK